MVLSAFALARLSAPAWAKDGDSGSGSSGSGSSGSGSGDSGGDGGGDDSDDSDDSGGDDGDSDNSGSGSNNSGRRGEDHYRARDAVARGDALSLEDVMNRLGQRYPGRVIDVKLGNDGKRLVYSFKVKTTDGIVRKVTMDAKTGKFRGIFGF